MTKPSTTQGTPDEPKSTAERKPPQEAQADRATPPDKLLSPDTATEPSIKNR